MQAELKAKWVAALRSGKYQQSSDALRTEDGFCCLGVLCDIVDPEGWVDNRGCGGYRWKSDKFGEHSAILPAKLIRAFEVAESLEAAAIRMNDGSESFIAIADYIEKND